MKKILALDARNQDLRERRTCASVQLLASGYLPACEISRSVISKIASFADRPCSGLLQLLNLLIGIAPSFPSDGLHLILRQWGKPGQIGDGLSSWPTDFSRGILPIPCHSHNDYWRRVPLYSAIEAGCISIEADVWLIEGEIYVGHSRASLTNERTFANLYINPLLDILAHQNPTTSFHPNGNSSLDGVFDTTPEKSLVLLIDFKTDGPEIWPHIISSLEPLRARNYLSHHDENRMIQGPLTVVGTGNTPFELVSSKSSNPHLDVFFDAPLDQMWESKEQPSALANSSSLEISPSIDQDLYNATNSYYASASFADTIGYPWQGQLTDQQLSIIRGQLAGAHKRGLKARYWELPFWPIGLRNHIWDLLVKEGIDLLNVDDLAAATQQKWT